MYVEDAVLHVREPLVLHLLRDVPPAQGVQLVLGELQAEPQCDALGRHVGHLPVGADSLPVGDNIGVLAGDGVV